MKKYGVNKATEFTKKQINVIFGMAKRGELKVQKFVMQNFYDLAEYYGYDDNKNIETCEKRILDILENAFAGNREIAQALIDEYTEMTYNQLSNKNKKLADKNLV